jgi:hypothetical protein
MRKSRSALVSTLLAIALVALGVPGALASIPQHRITHYGPDGNLNKQASFPDVAFNSRTKEYLVVYAAGAASHDNHWVIYGQRVDASGKAVGNRVLISSKTDRYLSTYEPPAVAYARNINQFLVTWDEGTLSGSDDAIYVRRISGSGTPLGHHDLRISDRGYRDIETTVPVYNPQRKEWMVAWNAEAPGEPAGIQALWAQRLTAKGKQVGQNDRRLTNTNVNAFDANDAIGLAYDPKDHVYLAVVRGMDSTVPGSEVFGHLMNAKGQKIGPPQFRISHVTDTNPTNGRAIPPSVAYDPGRDRFLVAWPGNPQVGSMSADEIDIFGRFVKPNGTVVGSQDIRFSSVGPDGNSNFQPVRPDIGFNPFLHEFLFAWSGDNNKAGGVDDESEAWGQHVANNGALVGKVGFRISHSGPDGNTNFAANRPAVAFDGSNCSYLVVWSSGNVGNWGGPKQEWDIYDNVLSTSCPR